LPKLSAKTLAILAEKIMLVGYELIGDSKLSAKGSFLGSFLSNRISIRNIENIKKVQVGYYEKKLRRYLPIKLSILDEDKKHIRGYPVILSNSNSLDILNYLRNEGLLVRFELNGSRWSDKQKIIYLPLGLQMTVKQQDEVCHLVKEALMRSHG
jgi:hypothetical protein